MKNNLLVFSLLMLTISLTIRCNDIFDPDHKNDNTWSVVQHGIRFRIWTDKAVYKEGDAIWLYAEFENVSDSNIVILVNASQLEPSIMAPLYDFEKLIVSGASSSSTNEYIPVESNMYITVPNLYKILPAQTYDEKTNMSVGLWGDKKDFEQTGERVNFFPPKPGKYTLQLAYHWEELPYATPDRQQQLKDMEAPLWQGYLESNKIIITVI